MQIQLILGNQLFDPKMSLSHLEPGSIIFMREDRELCTHFKYHKHKIMFFLSAMRKYARALESRGYVVHYEVLNMDQDLSFEDAFLKFLEKYNSPTIHLFEVEDKFLEQRLLKNLKERGLQVIIKRSPMFLTTRQSFADYLQKSKKPFMKTFYEAQRKKLNILVDAQQQPLGGRWSFDDENRKRVPKSYAPPPILKYSLDEIDREVGELVEQCFSDHPGQVADYWLPGTHREAQAWLDDFLQNRLVQFGEYEDALSTQYDFINHSVLASFINVGLLTPQQIVVSTLAAARTHQVPLNSVEGFIRQVIGWREFVRGIYQNFSEQQDQLNFWSHQRKLSELWIHGNTGVPPLDSVIKKVNKIGYAHHIERLMVVGSLMVLLEVHPQEAHRWFMEMFVDSSDWVMGPNVYGMALFSDGGIFSTKPYICGSNYYKKMGDFPKGEWEDGVDGLYWMFIEKNRSFFESHARMPFALKNLDEISAERKEKIFAHAVVLQQRLTV